MSIEAFSLQACANTKSSSRAIVLQILKKSWDVSPADAGMAAGTAFGNLLCGETFAMDNDIIAVDVMLCQALRLKAQAS